MILTPNQISEILSILEVQQLDFIGSNIGSEVLSSDDKKILKNAGIDPTHFSKEGLIEDAYRWGMLSDAIGHSRAKDMTYGEFKKFVSSKNYIPLNNRELTTVDLYKQQAYSDSKNLLGKMQSDVNRAISASALNSIGDQKKFESLVRSEGKKSVIDRKSVTEFASVLREKSEDWNRDMGRIADFVSHQAFDAGRAAHIYKQSGEDAKVYKNVYPGGCRHCIRLYLTGGIGSEPKVFKLSTITSNGTNIGRKPEDWKPVIGPTHPFCRCTLHKYDEGSEFDQKEGMFKLVKKEPKVARKSKAKITIGGKTTEI